MTMTKKELEALVQKLKSENFQLQDQLERVEIVKSDVKLENIGFSIVKDEGKYYLVEIAFDFGTKACAITKIDVANRLDNDYQMAMYSGKKHFVEQIMGPKHIK